MARVGYDRGGSTRDFAGLDCDEVFVDTKATGRQERADLALYLKAGDTLVLLRKGALGAGPGVTAIRKQIEDMGVTIEVAENLPKPAETRGRPETAFLSPDQLDRIEPMWRDQLTYDQATVLRRASQIAGAQVKKYHLEYRLGNRGDKKRPKR